MPEKVKAIAKEVLDKEAQIQETVADLVEEDVEDLAALIGGLL